MNRKIPMARIKNIFTAETRSTQRDHKYDLYLYLYLIFVFLCALRVSAVNLGLVDR
jgi:hypothetical protein